MNNIKKTSLKGIMWTLLIAVFTIKSCDVFSTYKSCDIENSSDESPGEDGFKLTAKKLFSCTEDDASHTNLYATIATPAHWSVYSFIIFKEPLRDVLTPPPNQFFA